MGIHKGKYGELTITGVNIPIKSWTVTSEDLAEVKMLHPKIINDSEFKKIQGQIEAEAIQMMGIPPLLLGDESSYSNCCTTAASAPTKEMSDNAMRVMLDFKHGAAVARLLPDWIVDGRWRIAALLELSGRVFEHNLRQMATLHGMRQF